jgi:hypothetical protein
MKAAHDRATLPRGSVDCGSTSHVAAGCPGPKQPRQPIGHVLKSEPRQFQDVIEGAKVFEVRKDDRDFATGDTVVLVEYDPATEQHTGRSTTRAIGYLGRGAPYPAGWCAFALTYGEPMGVPEMNGAMTGAYKRAR